MQAVLKGSAGRIRAVFTDSDGAAAAPSAPKVTITRDSDGTVIDSAVSATDEGAGIVSHTLTAAEIPAPDLLHAVWTATTGYAAPTEIAVVGGFLCSLEAISDAIDASPAPTTLTLRELREAAEERIEDACGVAFRPTYRREQLRGDGAAGLLLSARRPTEILSASIDGTSVLADVSLDGDQAVYESGWSAGATIDITYVHGYAAPPEPISRAAISLARYLLLDDPSNVFDRATSYTTEEATYSLVTPGVRGMETPIPEVNATIDAYRETVVA